MIKTVICDIDETLVYSRKSIPGSVAFIDYEGETRYTLMRPGAQEFLNKLKEKEYKIISVTQGVVPFQRSVLKAVGLIEYFDEIYGWTSYHRNEATKPDLENHKWVLVDNLTHYDPTLWEKAAWLGAELDPDINFINCKEFSGHPETECLTNLIPKIEELLNK